MKSSIKYFSPLLLAIPVGLGIVAIDSQQEQEPQESSVASASNSPEVSTEAVSVVEPTGDETGFESEAPGSPTISYEDQQRGIAEGNPYVVYSGVMCFGGTIPNNDEIERMSSSEAEKRQLQEYKNSVPQQVLDQSDINRKIGIMFTAPQECYDAGWINPGPV